MPSFHSNPILFYIPGWTLLKTKIHTEAWMNLSLNSEIKRPVTIWVLLSLDGTWGGAFQGEGPVSAASGMLSLCLGGKFAYNPEAIYSFPSFLERLRNLIPLPQYLDYYLGLLSGLTDWLEFWTGHSEGSM